VSISGLIWGAGRAHRLPYRKYTLPKAKDSVSAKKAWISLKKTFEAEEHTCKLISNPSLLVGFSDYLCLLRIFSKMKEYLKE
jgi:hypothetical protein